MTEVEQRAKNLHEVEKEVRLRRMNREDEEHATRTDTKAELIRLLRRLEKSLNEQRHSEKVATAGLSTDQYCSRQIFRIGTARSAEGL